jgi:hypothetical protein
MKFNILKLFPRDFTSPSNKIPASHKLELQTSINKFQAEIIPLTSQQHRENITSNLEEEKTKILQLWPWEPLFLGVK